VGACALVLANAAFKTSDIIGELKERKTGIDSKKTGRRFSPLLLVGILLNSYALRMGNTISVYLKYGFHIIAFIFVAIGVFMTIRCRRK